MWPLVLMLATLFSVGVFVSNALHVLNSLVVLEYLVLILYTQFCIGLYTSASTGFSIIALFVVSVTSAAVGLSMLIPLTRSHGQDYFSAFQVLW